MMDKLVKCVGFFFFFQAEDGIRDYKVTGVQTCALSDLLAAALIQHESHDGCVVIWSRVLRQLKLGSSRVDDSDRRCAFQCFGADELRLHVADRKSVV